VPGPPAHIFAAAQAVHADTPIENVLAIYEEATGRTLIGG